MNFNCLFLSYEIAVIDIVQQVTKNIVSISDNNYNINIIGCNKEYLVFIDKDYWLLKIYKIKKEHVCI